MRPSIRVKESRDVLEGHEVAPVAQPLRNGKVVSMDIDKDIKLAVGWNRVNLRVFGAWPEPIIAKEDRLSNFRFLLANILIVGFICAPQSINFVIIWGDIDLMTENLATANIPVMNSIMKMFFIWYHKNDLRPLMSSFFDDWQNCTSEDDRWTMRKTAKKARKISLACAILTQTMVTIYLSLRVATVTQLDRNQTAPDRMVLYPGYFPYDARQSPAFELTIAGQILSAYCSTTFYTIVDSFISMLVLHTCGQITNLRRILTNLFDENANVKSCEDFQKKLAWIVRRHDHLNWFAKTVDECFNLLLFGQMLACTVQLCFQGYQAFRISQAGESATMLLVFLSFSICFVGAHLFLYCYVGEMLIVQSTALNSSAYESKWYNASSKEAEGLLVIMLRTTISLRLTAGKFGTFSLEMFSRILRTSMGYLSVLLTVTNHID